MVVVLLVSTQKKAHTNASLALGGAMFDRKMRLSNPWTAFGWYLKGHRLTNLDVRAQTRMPGVDIIVGDSRKKATYEAREARPQRERE